MRIGFDAYTIEHRGLSVEQTLDFAREHRLEGVQFLEPSALVPDLDRSKLLHFRRAGRVQRAGDRDRAAVSQPREAVASGGPIDQFGRACSGPDQAY